MGTVRKKPARLGEKLAQVRHGQNVSLAEMAELLSDAEVVVRRQDVFRFERGERDPSLIILLKYARLIGVPLEVFADDKLTLP
jgi:transcriptional regulator with XRE-family HTH domain